VENEKAFWAPNYGNSSTAKYRRKKTPGKAKTLEAQEEDATRQAANLDDAVGVVADSALRRERAD
jgi:hypothetical protein